MPPKPPRRPPGDDAGYHDTDRRDVGEFLDDGDLIETDDSLISDFDDLEAPAKPKPRRPVPPLAPRPPSQQMPIPRDEPPPPPPRPPAPRPPSQQMRRPPDDLDLPPPQAPVPPRPTRQQRAVSLNRPAEEVVAPSAATIGSVASDTDMSQGLPGPDGVRLIVVEGANKGEEYSLERDVVGLGRGADNDIVIRDVSVSRKHAKVLREEGEYRLVDLGSGNGTLLNGRKVTDERLVSGSVFKMGNTVMRFVQVGDVYSTREDICDSGLGFAAPAAVATPLPAPAPARPRQPDTAVGAARQAAAGGRSKAILLWGGLIVVLLLSVAAVVKFVILAPEGGGTEAAKGAADPAQLRKLFDDGVEAFKRQDWKQAGEKFAALLAQEPGNERARQYKSKIEEELDYKDSLAQAREYVGRRNLRPAIENLKKIPAESSYGAEARALLVQIKDEYVRARIGEGRTLFDDRKLQAAYDAFADVLAVDPSNSEAIRLKGDAAEAIRKGGETVKEPPPAVAGTGPKPVKERPSTGERPVKEKPDKGPKGKEPPSDDMPPPPTTPGPAATGPIAQRAVGLFRQGNVNGAIQAIEAAGAASDPKLSKLVGDLRGFAQAFSEGENYYRGKQDEPAIQSLGRAIQYGKAIASSGENAYAQKIAGMVADMYYLRGVKAFYKENYLVAAQNFQQALKYKPDHQQSQGKLKEMSAVAGRLYEEGYVLKAADPEGARKKFQTIIQITSPDNDYHKKAKEWLKKL